jgi:hypothetical protein
MSDFRAFESSEVRGHKKAKIIIFLYLVFSV